jgi:hypothetical protein
MTAQESSARVYCISLGLDPDELVLGINDPKHPGLPAGPFIKMPRWQWYVGARLDRALT